MCDGRSHASVRTQSLTEMSPGPMALPGERRGTRKFPLAKRMAPSLPGPGPTVPPQWPSPHTRRSERGPGIPG